MDRCLDEDVALDIVVRIQPLREDGQSYDKRNDGKTDVKKDFF